MRAPRPFQQQFHLGQDIFLKTLDSAVLKLNQPQAKKAEAELLI